MCTHGNRVRAYARVHDVMRRLCVFCKMHAFAKKKVTFPKAGAIYSPHMFVSEFIFMGKMMDNSRSRQTVVAEIKE